MAKKVNNTFMAEVIDDSLAVQTPEFSPPVMLNTRSKGGAGGGLQTYLESVLVGQEQAIEDVVDLYRVYMCGLHPVQKPMGSMLMLGPTGSGKTRLAEAFTQFVMGDPSMMVKIDCGEFQLRHEMAKLIGSPPGYLGHRETPARLRQEALGDDTRPSVVLFDEIEKASDGVWNMILGILDKATLTLGDNKVTNFSNTMLFMTGNLGANELNALVNGSGLGFQKPKATGDVHAKSESIVQSAARKRFTPEFINRLDKVVTFHHLGLEHLYSILDIELQVLQSKIIAALSASAFLFALTDEAKTFVVEKGYDQKYNARHLKRAVHNLVVKPLSVLITTNQIAAGDLIEVGLDVDTQSLSFHLASSGMSHSLVQMLGESK